MEELLNSAKTGIAYLNVCRSRIREKIEPIAADKVIDGISSDKELELSRLIDAHWRMTDLITSANLLINHIEKDLEDK